MGRYSHGVLGAAVFALCTVSIAAPASAAGCWTRAEVSAAKVREMQTRLMVTARACTAGGVDILPSYDKFVAMKRNALSAADERLRNHFLAEGSDLGERDYARYTAALELAYGAATASGDSCAEAATLAREAAASRIDLVAVADREVTVATLPSSLCPANGTMVLAAN
jgi:hypothetical protein